jgi:hypothetical protein
MNSAIVGGKRILTVHDSSASRVSPRTGCHGAAATGVTPSVKPGGTDASLPLPEIGPYLARLVAGRGRRP